MKKKNYIVPSSRVYKVSFRRSIAEEGDLNWPVGAVSNYNTTKEQNVWEDEDLAPNSSGGTRSLWSNW